MVIPSNEVRVIKELPSFYLTAAFSLGAYVWTTFILVVNTKDQVDIWEAIVTFLFLPLMVWMSYKSDNGAVDWILVKLRLIKPDKANLATQLHGARHSQFVQEVRSSLRATSKELREEAVEMAKEKVALVGFKEEHMVVSLTNEDQKIRIPVVASGYRGIKGVKAKFTTHRFTAVPDVAYTHIDGGIVVFDEEETEKFIELTISAWTGNKVRSSLLLILEDAQGADFHPDTDGGDQCAILTVILSAHLLGAPEGWRRVLGAVVDMDGVYFGLSSWKEQLFTAVYVGGDPEESKDASASDWALHLMALPWKLIFALCPPPCFFGGWLCFFGSLFGIAVLTSFVSDLAELFGCVIGTEDVVTGITFVALGTSMPDLFASLAAATGDETADASVVNVTGSNSVNVFLGLGLPWTICSIYWAFKERTPQWESCYPEMAAKLNAAGDLTSMVFVVEAGFVGFSVLTFCVVCLSTLFIIMLRRRYLHAELGGPFRPKIICGSVMLMFWISWISVVTWRVFRFEIMSFSELAGGGILYLSVVFLGVLVAFVSIYRNRITDVQAREAQAVRRFSTRSSNHSESEHLDRESVGEPSAEITAAKNQPGQQLSEQGSIKDPLSGEIAKDSAGSGHATDAGDVVEGL